MSRCSRFTLIIALLERHREAYEEAPGLKAANLCERRSIEEITLLEKPKSEEATMKTSPISSLGGCAKLPDYNRGKPVYKLQRMLWTEAIM
jgi:hypothetical protein